MHYLRALVVVDVGVLFLRHRHKVLVMESFDVSNGLSKLQLLRRFPNRPRAGGSSTKGSEAITRNTDQERRGK